MSNSQLPWFPFYVNDFLVKSMELTAQQTGILIQMLATQWNKAGRKPGLSKKAIRALASRLKAMAETDLSSIDEDVQFLLATEFIETIDDGEVFYLNVELHEAWINQVETHKKRSDAGRKGGRAKARDKPGLSNRTKAGLKQEESEPETDSKSISHPPPRNQPDGNSEFGKAWQRWLDFRFARDGTHVDQIRSDTWLMRLQVLPPDKAIADINFSIEKDAKSIIDSSNDFSANRMRRPRSKPGSAAASLIEKMKGTTQNGDDTRGIAHRA